ncbi:GIY-YIG nuclease family protein [Endozoicomonas sp. SM1973]|uniref:GIY-YIG nuclease family protein n=1 Tax=Spartinivicinus marinus TaxID=2994442 RepID=A0A853I7H7_9GAMM|nr:GIY-YIG nuclease family protein [Spartinivicinus marinus]MCX4025606.1 GIY-YIG nuclease family protein [Spartinivicinus marinus]NYZ65165.1 GIY-YIG nuclease family protein [Spartinivicinus marinus]
MIIFTITNKVTGQVFVGSTRNSLESQWAKIVSAAEQGLDYPLYKQICRYGDDQFDVEEWDFADTREELMALEQEAVDSLQAESLRGYKTAVTQRRVVTAPKKRASSSRAKPSTSEPSDTEEGSAEKTASVLPTEAKVQPEPEPEIEVPAPQPVAPVEKPVSILAQLTASAKAYKRSCTPATKNKAAAKSNKEASGLVEVDSEQLDSLFAKVSAYSSQAKPESEQPTAVSNKIDDSGLASSDSLVETKTVEAPEPVYNEHQQRILAAINKQRQLRSERTPTVIEQERKQLADLLTKLELRAVELKQPIAAS